MLCHTMQVASYLYRTCLQIRRLNLLVGLFVGAFAVCTYQKQGSISTQSSQRNWYVSIHKQCVISENLCIHFTYTALLQRPPASNCVQLARSGGVGQVSNYKKAPKHRMHPNPLCVFGDHQVYFLGCLRWRKFRHAQADEARLRWREHQTPGLRIRPWVESFASGYRLASSPNNDAHHRKCKEVRTQYRTLTNFDRYWTSIDQY